MLLSGCRSGTEREHDMETRFSRVRSFLLVRESGFTGSLRWSGFEGGDHVFLTPSGREVHVDLVLGTVQWFN